MIEELVNKEKCKVIFLVEHWLHENERNIIESDFENYNIIFKSDMEYEDTQKSGRPYGGKCWLIDKEIEILNFDFHNDISMIEITTKGIKLKLIGVWLPYDNKGTINFANFENSLSLIEQLICDYRISRTANEHLSIIGDFNADTKRGKRFDKLLNNLIINNKLIDGIMNFEQTTNFTYQKGDYKSIIDHILYCEELSMDVNSCFIYDNSTLNFSDHKPIVLEINVKEKESNCNSVPEHPKRTYFHRFNWKNEEFKYKYQTNLELLALDLLKIINGSRIVNESIERELIDNVFRMIPTILLKAARNSESDNNKKFDNDRKLTKRYKQNKIISEHIEHTKELHTIMRNSAYEDFENNKKNWKESKKQLKSLIRKERFGKIKLNSKEIDKYLIGDKNRFWKEVNKRKKRTKTNADAIKSNLCINDFEIFYEKLFSHQDKSNNPEQEDINQEVKQYQHEISNVRYEPIFDEQDIINAMSKLKSDKACGVDKIANEFFKHGITGSLIKILLWFFNSCSATGYLLENFNVSKLSPIPKKGKTDKPEDYRPISVSTSITTLFEYLLLGKIKCFENIHRNQFGYKKMTSSKNAYFVVNEVINMYAQGDSRIHVISLDASKAFDKLWRNGLFFKLKNKMEPVIWRLLYNYYDKSKICVFFENKSSNPIKSSEGVKQGGILSPHLFNYFTNDLIETICSQNIGAQIGKMPLSIIAYCDDIVLLASHRVDMLELIKLCDDFAKKWKIDFNPKKSNCVTFNSKGETEHHHFIMNGESIPCVDGFIYLGLPIGNNAFIDQYIDKGFKKMQRSMYSLYSLGFKPKLVCPQTVAFVFKQYCQSILRYCLDNVKIPCKKIDEIDIRQNTLLKNAIGLSKYVKTTPLLKCLKVESIRQIYQKSKIRFTKQIEQNDVCKYVYKFLRKKYNRTVKFKKNNKSFIKQIVQIEEELRIGVDEYSNEVILMLIEYKERITEENVVNAISQVILDIKIRLRYGKDHLFLYRKLAEALNYKDNLNNHLKK
jgi:hypothetical protein